VIRGTTRASLPRRAMPAADQQHAAVPLMKLLPRFPSKSVAIFLALTAAIPQSADTNITRSAQYCYGRALFQDVAGLTYTDIVKTGKVHPYLGLMVERGSRRIGKGKVHRCTGTEALYRLYGP